MTPRHVLARVTRRAAHSAVHAAWAAVKDAGEVRPGTRSADRFGSFGEDSSVGFPAATLMNVGSVHVGRSVLIGRHVTLSVGYSEGDPSARPRGLVIGDRCVIGARSVLTAHESIELEDDVWLGQDVFVCDASHGYQLPDVPIGLQMGPHAAVRIGAGSWVGHGAIVLPGTTIGRNVVVAAGSVVRGTVADHAVVGGSPARVLRSFEPGRGWVTPAGDLRPVFG